MLDRAVPAPSSKGSAEDPDLERANTKSQTAFSGDSPTGSPPVTIHQSNHSEYHATNEYPNQHPSSPHFPHGQTSPGQRREQPTSHPQSRGGQKGGTRTTSKGGGVQVVLDDTGSWSDLAHQPNGSGEREGGRSAASVSGPPGKPNGMLGFLSRKKGRQRSPKPMEAGVLGKEGARVVVGGR